MKKLLFFLFWVATTKSYAQVQLGNQLGPKLAVGYANMNYSSLSSATAFSKLFDSLQQGGLHVEVGATYKHRISREFSISGSVSVAQFRINYLANSLPSLAACRQNLVQINLPIGIEYNLITENWQPFFGLYLQGAKIIKSTMTYQLQEVWNSVTETSNLPEHTLLYGISMATGAQLPITKQFTLEPSVFATYSLRSLSGSAAQRPLNLAFQTTLMYNF
jgi:hypothetical protein